jgi:hypothetical protein
MTLEELREDLDIVLMFIRESTLTGAEFESIESYFPNLENVELLQEYQALFFVLSKRGGEGNSIRKLKYYFYIKLEDEAVLNLETDYNNVIIGAVLD